MASDGEAKRLLYKVSVAYYVDDLTQKEIAKRLGLSRIKVSRLLKQAREEGIVQITITPPANPHADLERALESRFGLDEAVVVAANGEDRRSLLQALGPAAAACLVRGLQGNEVIGLTWGTSVLSAVDAAPSRNWPELRVVQVIGGLGQPEADVHGAELVHRLAHSLGGRPRVLPAPGIVPSRLVRDALLADPQIADTLRLAARAHAALVGIGVVTAPDSVVRQAGTILTDAEISELEARGAVGDIALRFFDAQGRPIEHEINERVVGLDLEQIRRLPRVIGVAGGPQKLEAIRGALRGRLISTLVTDEQTATRLLEAR
ncbi:MAG: sugar-binding transcriptional regulator [Anaerolineae bacterium]|nr:sugar-binding transcriptional regulator [Anaerolineae bacterium]